MTAKDHGHEQGSPVAQGMRFDGLTGPQREKILGEAFDYRGDVTLRLEDGSSVTGYVFAVEAGREPHLKMFPADAASDRLRIPLARIVGCEFSGRDTADGRSWEAWVKRWEEKRRLLAQGVDVGDIEPKPEELG